MGERSFQDGCVANSISSVAETGGMALRFFSRKVDFMRWFPLVFLNKGVFIVTHGGIELTTLVL